MWFYIGCTSDFLKCASHIPHIVFECASSERAEQGHRRMWFHCQERDKNLKPKFKEGQESPEL